MHVGGSLIADGSFASLFSQDEYMRAVRGRYGEGYSVHNWSYPPTMFWPAMLFSLFDYYFALFLWFLLGAVLLFFVVRVLGLPSFWMLAIFFSPAGLANIIAGQNGFITASLLTFAFVFAAQKPVVAGFNWALLTVKPHLGLVALPLLVVNGQWKVIGVGAVVFACFVGSTLVMWGFEPWVQFLNYTTRQQQMVLENWDGLLVKTVPTAFMQGRNWELGVPSAYMLHAFFTCIGVWLAIRAWPDRNASLRRRLTWFVITTFLILPYSFIYDLVVFQIALILWIRDPAALFVMKRSTSRILWKLFWLLPLLSIFVVIVLSIQLVPIVFAFIPWRLGVKSMSSARTSSA